MSQVHPLLQLFLSMLTFIRMSRLELSACGGDWPPAERRKFMQAASARPKLLYRSTDN